MKEYSFELNFLRTAKSLQGEQVLINDREQLKLSFVLSGKLRPVLGDIDCFVVSVSHTAHEGVFRYELEDMSIIVPRSLISQGTLSIEVCAIKGTKVVRSWVCANLCLRDIGDCLRTELEIMPDINNLNQRVADAEARQEALESKVQSIAQLNEELQKKVEALILAQNNPLN